MRQMHEKGGLASALGWSGSFEPNVPVFSHENILKNTILVKKAIVFRPLGG